MCVGLKIKAFIDESGISQTFISEKTKIPLPKLNLTLNGKRKMTFEEYELLCGVLNVNTDRFLTPKLPNKKYTN